MTGFVLWTPPRLQGKHLDDRIFPATALERFGSILISARGWASVPAECPTVPEELTIRPPDGNALFDAWTSGGRGPKEAKDLVPWLRNNLLAADTLDVPAAIEQVHRWVQWFQERSDTSIEGVIAETEQAQYALEKLYFDGPGYEDWPAFVTYSGSCVPAFGTRHTFTPAEMRRTGMRPR